MDAATAAGDHDEDSGVQKLKDSRELTQRVEGSHGDDDRDDDGEGKGHTQHDEEEEDEDDGEEEDGDDDEDEEPRLKYVRLTGNLSAVYRNGDATSCFLVAGDKMVCICTCLRMGAY
jgi:hypothetical protein